MMDRIRSLAVRVLTAAALAGCTTVGPEYAPPAMEVPDAFLASTEPTLTADAVEKAWWRQFGDPTLDELVARALAANHDVQIAVARLREARAFYREIDYDRFPRVTAEAGATAGLLAEVQAPGQPRDRRDNPLYSAGFDAFWEIDFFGRVRRSIEASAAEAERAEAGVRDARVTVIAEVARTYFELRGLESQLAVAHRNVENEREIVAFVQVRLELGRGTELDTTRARAQLHSTASAIPALEAAIARSLYRLAVLTGRRPDRLDLVSTRERLPAVTHRIPIGDPAALLRRRPDIRAVERALAAASARIGVATADLFPRVTLLGTLGLAAGSGSAFAASGSETYSLGAVLSWPAFDLGRVRERLRQTEARAEAALAYYEQTVLRALEETESALVTYARQRAQLVTLQESERESARAAALARLRFDNGIVDFLTVLDAERTLNNVRDRVASNETQLYTALIAVYKALGGGWDLVEAGPPV